MWPWSYNPFLWCFPLHSGQNTNTTEDSNPVPSAACLHCWFTWYTQGCWTISKCSTSSRPCTRVSSHWMPQVHCALFLPFFFFSFSLLFFNQLRKSECFHPDLFLPRVGIVVDPFLQTKWEWGLSFSFTEDGCKPDPYIPTLLLRLSASISSKKPSLTTQPHFSLCWALPACSLGSKASLCHYETLLQWPGHSSTPLAQAGTIHIGLWIHNSTKNTAWNKPHSSDCFTEELMGTGIISIKVMHLHFILYPF